LVVPAVFTIAFALTRFIQFIHSGIATYAFQSATVKSVVASTAITVNHFLPNIVLQANASGVTANVSLVQVFTSVFIANSTIPLTVVLASGSSHVFVQDVLPITVFSASVT